MQSNFYCFLFCFFLVGCSSKQIVTQNCNNEFDKTLKVGFFAASSEINTCLAKFNRADDLKLYTNLLKRKITITCDPSTTATNLAIAETNTSPDFPGLKVYTSKFNNENVLQNTLAHESLHWLGYEHYLNYDLAYIAEMCCLDHKDKFLNEIGQQSCALLTYKNEEWKNPKYISDLTKYLGFFGRSFIGVRTSINAAIYAKQSNYPDEYIAQILEAPTLIVTDGFDSNNATIKKYFSKSPDVTQAIVIAYLIGKSKAPFTEKLIQNYYK